MRLGTDGEIQLSPVVSTLDDGGRNFKISCLDVEICLGHKFKKCFLVGELGVGWVSLSKLYSIILRFLWDDLSGDVKLKIGDNTLRDECARLGTKAAILATMSRRQVCLDTKVCPPGRVMCSGFVIPWVFCQSLVHLTGDRRKCQFVTRSKILWVLET